MVSETNYPMRIAQGFHVSGQQPLECTDYYLGLLDSTLSKQLADWIAPTATSHAHTTGGPLEIMPRAPMCRLFTIYTDLIDIARMVVDQKYRLNIGYQPITSTVFGHTPWHDFLLPAHVRSVRMHVRQDSVYKSCERLYSSLSTYRIGTWRQTPSMFYIFRWLTTPASPIVCAVQSTSEETIGLVGGSHRMDRFGVMMGANTAALFDQMEGWWSPWDVQTCALYALQIIVHFPF